MTDGEGDLDSLMNCRTSPPKNVVHNLLYEERQRHFDGEKHTTARLAPAQRWLIWNLRSSNRFGLVPHERRLEPRTRSRPLQVLAKVAAEQWTRFLRLL